MKVVYNACYGGFGLNDAAIVRYWEIKGMPKPDDWWERSIDRDDPTLIQVVEELGQAAGDKYSDLKIKDVPSGTRWRIDEYDGYEQVMTVDDYDWKTAT